MRQSIRRVAVLSLFAPALAAAQQKPNEKTHVTYPNGRLTLAGYVYKPSGPGPFPTVLWNHGSEQFPDRGPQFDSVAAIFVPAGYAVFAPMRRGHGDSQGTWVTDLIDAARAAGGMDSAARLQTHLLETEQLDDQLAGLAYAKTLPFVDTTRLVVAGCSYGGIQTLLGAERGTGYTGYKAAFSISPAALSWSSSPPLQKRLASAVARIDMPVLLIQPPKDASLEPARVLGAAAKRAGKTRFVAKVYPATMPEGEQVHCFGGAKGMHNWAKEAVAFFNDALGSAAARR